MTKITVIMITCRDDYPIIGNPNLHLFTPLIESLNEQTLKDFELIIVDSLHKYRNTRPVDEALFKLKHIPPKQSPWLDLGMFHVCNSLNTAISYSTGQLIVMFNDCMEFDTDYLEIVWNNYLNGFLTLPTFTYLYDGFQAYYTDEIFEEMIKKGNYSNEEEVNLRKGWSAYEIGDIIRDTRYNQISEEYKIVDHQWFYGISTTTRTHAYEINGFDEALDGCRGLTDCDFGSRLEMKNPSIKFLYDKRLIIREHIQGGLSKRIMTKDIPIWKNNLAIYQINRVNQRIVANSRKYDETELNYIKNMVDPDNFNAELFNLWIKNQRQFKIGEEND